MHYLDNSATTPLCDSVKKAITESLDNFGNPSSLHRLGMQALEILDECREKVAAKLGVLPKEIYFTSCGTEANNTAIFGAANCLHHRGKHIITSLIEHHSVLNAFKVLESRGFDVTYLTPDQNGVITPDAVQNAMRDDTVFVSIMAVNNEVGSVMDIKKIAKIVHSNNALFHTDCVQALGKIDISHCDADMISLSGHKIHAPKGIGVLYINRSVNIPSLLYGGGQEKNMRSGTEATLLIKALSAAIDDLPDEKTQYAVMRELQQYAFSQLQQIEGIVINSKPDNLPYIINFSLPGLPSEVMLHSLESREVFVSSGSACAKNQKSHVLTAMKTDDSAIKSAVRVSFSRFTTREDIDALIDGVKFASKLVRRKK